MIKAPAKQLDLFLDFSLDFSLVIQKQFASVSWKFEEKQSWNEKRANCSKYMYLLLYVQLHGFLLRFH